MQAPLRQRSVYAARAFNLVCPCPRTLLNTLMCRGTYGDLGTLLMQEANGDRFRILCRSMAGHSHWANIKFKKMHADNKRSKIFGKLSLEIATVVRENGPDPGTNSKLQNLLLRARAVNMPKDNIEGAIKNGVKDKSSLKKRVVLEVRGEEGSAFLVELLTTNPTKAKAEIRSILRKFGVGVSERGSVLFMFDEKGVIRVSHGNLQTAEDVESQVIADQLFEEAEEAAISVNAEEVLPGVKDDGSKIFQFLCHSQDLDTVVELLQNKPNYTIESCCIEYVARDTVTLKTEILQRIDRLVHLLIDYEDVVNVYDNVGNYPSTTCKLGKTKQ